MNNDTPKSLLGQIYFSVACFLVVGFIFFAGGFAWKCVRHAIHGKQRRDEAAKAIRKLAEGLRNYTDTQFPLPTPPNLGTPLDQPHEGISSEPRNEEYEGEKYDTRGRQ